MEEIIHTNRMLKYAVFLSDHIICYFTSTITAVCILLLSQLLFDIDIVFVCAVKGYMNSIF